VVHGRVTVHDRERDPDVDGRQPQQPPQHQDDKDDSSSNNSNSCFVDYDIVHEHDSNSTVSILKDRAYAQMYGISSTTMVVPRIAYGLWIARDLTVIGSSFVLPPYVTQLLRHDTNNNNPVRMVCTNTTSSSSSIQSPSPMLTADASAKLAQLLSPVLAQVVAGPLHYVGIYYCNRPPSSSVSFVTRTERLKNRIRFLRNGLTEIVTVWMIRVLRGYRIGGVYNTYYRTEWRNYVAA
jgi:hypothetical protein